MLRQVLLSKIHRATVTECDLNYNGSICIDTSLLHLTGMREYERVEIYNLNNGARFATYIIPGKENSGAIGINGAAARLVQPGDKVIILNYGMVDEQELAGYQPVVVVVDENNRPV
ncbi:MAG: aspartate 1-decarboxylase [Candidatus Cloacimonetes bacterium]|nr:aspartate 1-decarboxylase [Candidatus Cloacimonadota bacterium]